MSYNRAILTCIRASHMVFAKLTLLCSTIPKYICERKGHVLANKFGGKPSTTNIGWGGMQVSYLSFHDGKRSALYFLPNKAIHVNIGWGRKQVSFHDGKRSRLYFLIRQLVPCQSIALLIVWYSIPFHGSHEFTRYTLRTWY